MDEIIAVDIETGGLDPFNDPLLGVSVASHTKATWYPHPNPVPPLGAVRKVGHNVRFDRKFLQCKGIILDGPFEDTILMAQLFNENEPLGLKPLSLKYIGHDATAHKKALDAHLRELKLKMEDLSNEAVDQRLVANYANEDTSNTLRLYHFLVKKLNDAELSYYREEMLPVEDVLMEMELSGVKIDLTALDTADVCLAAKMVLLKAKLNAMVETEVAAVERILRARPSAKQDVVFNWASSPQRILLFYGQLGLSRYYSSASSFGFFSKTTFFWSRVAMSVTTLKPWTICMRRVRRARTLVVIICVLSSNSMAICSLSSL